MYPQDGNPNASWINVQDLHSAEAVENNETEGTTLVVENSVCGCAARNARPELKWV
jgi:putative YphP/YqiW family bacilliredoxin